MPTSPAPDAAAPPGMCPGIVVLGGGGGAGDGSGDGSGGGDNSGGSGGGAGDGAGGDGKAAAGAPDPKKYPECGTAAHPVDVVTGRAFTPTLTDVILDGPLPLEVTRIYSSTAAQRDVGLGFGWASSLGWEIEVERRRVRVWNEQGMPIDFPVLPPGGEILGPWGWVLRRETWGYAVDADDGCWRLFSEAYKDGRRFRLTAIEDRNRNRIALTYDNGRLIEIKDSAGRLLRVVPTPDGHIAAIRVQNALVQGRWIDLVRYSYDQAGNLVAATDADGNAARYGYDEDHRLVSDSDRNGLTFHFLYDDRNRCVESWGDYPGAVDASLAADVPRMLADGITRAKGIHHCRFDYHAGGYSEVADSREVRRFFGNKFGLLDKAVAGGAVMSCSYDAGGRLLSRTDEVGATTVYERDRRGRVTREVDPLGRSRIAILDALGLPLEITDPAGGVTSFVRDRFGNPVSVRDPTGAITTYTYNAQGSVTEIVAPNGARISIKYDAMSNRTALIQPDGGCWRWTYDYLGRKTSETNAVGDTTRFVHSERGDLVAVHHAAGGTTRYGYDGEGHLISIIDPEGRRTDIAWGGYHKVVARRDGNGGIVQLKYNREGELVEVWNQRGEVHRLVYDPSGLLVEEHTFDDRRLAYRYDAAGRLVRIQSGERNLTTLVYNLAGELVERTSNDVVDTFAYDARGDMILAAGPAGAVSFERDAAGQIIREVQVVGGVAHEVRITLDPNGRRIGRVTSLGHTETIERDGGGARRRTVLDGAYEVAHVVDALGREIGAVLPRGGRIETGFHPQGRIERRAVASPTAHRPVGPGEPEWQGPGRGNFTVERTYGYDRSDELLWVTDPLRGSTGYAYDPVGQLLEAIHEKGQREVFRYDAAGNLFEVGQGAPPREYEKGNRLVRKGDATYRWDSDGRLIEKRIARIGEADQVWKYTWTGLGMLASVERPDRTLVEFTYDPLGRRVQKRLSAPRMPMDRSAPIELTRFVWDGDAIVHEIKQRAGANGDPVVEERTYCFDDDGFVPVAHRDTRGGAETAWFHYVTDPIGAPEELVDAAGEIACKLELRAWGRAVPAAGSRTTTPIRFQGQYADDETGLHYSRFRYYDPDAARFISADPIGLFGGVHSFAYGKNPTHWIDPLGLAVNTPNTGIIYHRVDPITKKSYVGKAKSMEAYKERKKAHDRKAKKKCPTHPGYNFETLETGIGGEPALSQAEEDWIRVGGGPGGKPGQTGPLENKIHGQAKDKYKGTIS
jgi:RHS repeat-associated protein